MLKEGKRYCDGCGQPLPPAARLFATSGGQDLCLNCRIAEAERAKAAQREAE